MPKLFLALLLIIGLTAFAQDPATKTPPLPNNKAASPDAANDLSKQPLVVEEFVNRYRWEADGTGTRQTILRAKVQSALGVQQLGQVPVGYSSANESVKINYVRVRKAGGDVVNVPESSAQDLTAPVAREAPMYSDFKMKQIIVPGLEPGDTLEYDITTSIVKPLAEHQFWMEHNFNKNNILLSEQLEVDIPAGVKVTLKTNPGFDPKVETRGGRRVYLWKNKNLKLDDDADDDDADASKANARRKKEETDPDRHPDVQMTTFQSWQELGNWYAELVKERVLPSDAIKAKALELTKDRSSDNDKVEALYDYVSKQYRYISLSFGIGRYQPHPAAEIFSNRYGDCKDKFTLLAAMLQSVGIQSQPVLINSWRHLDEAVPSPAQFDHVISAVNLGGKPMIVDATPEVAPFGLLSPTLRHKKALLVEAKNTHLIDTPSTLPFPPSQIVTVYGKVNELGKLEGSVKVTTRGDAELAFRSAFRQVPQARWNQLAKYFLTAMGVEGDATDVKTSSIEDTSKPFEAEWKVSATNYLDWTNKNVELRPPSGGTNLPQFPDESDKDRQKALLVYEAPSSVLYRISLKLPEG